MVCPKVRLSLGISRWMVAGKYPNILEKLWRGMVGVVLNCLLVREASSMAMRRPVIVTAKAASLRRGGIVMIGVLDGMKFEVMIRPAMILPQAKRLRGLMTEGLFSLIGESVRNRGVPMETKNTTRKL